MTDELMIEDHLRHVFTLEADGKPIQTKVRSRLFALHAFFRVQTLALNFDDLRNVEMPGNSGLRKIKCQETVIYAFGAAIKNAGFEVACLRDFKGELVDRYKGRNDQDRIQSELREFLKGERATGVRRILGL